MYPLASDCSLCLNQVHPSSPTCLSLGVMVTSVITLETGPASRPQQILPHGAEMNERPYSGDSRSPEALRRHRLALW